MRLNIPLHHHLQCLLVSCGEELNEVFQDHCRKSPIELDAFLAELEVFPVQLYDNMDYDHVFKIAKMIGVNQF